MSKTQSTLKDVAHEPTAEQPTIDLATIVAETTSTVAKLPDWEQFEAACEFTLETAGRTIDGDE